MPRGSVFVAVPHDACAVLFRMMQVPLGDFTFPVGQLEDAREHACSPHAKPTGV